MESGNQQQAGGQQLPVYNTENGGHYGASAAVAAKGGAPSPDLYQGPWTNVVQGLNGTYREILMTYWDQTIKHLENDSHDYKLHQLPLARIKKVMKADPEVKMISAEAPILFAKGCDIFITELTMRAWIHAEENKRRTLQRSDIASALGKSDMFDFLIDIVPREDATNNKRSANQGNNTGGQPQAQAPNVQQNQVNMPNQARPSGQANQHGMQDQYNMSSMEHQAGMYNGQVGNEAGPGYPSQPQMFGDMYYASMPAQQVRYDQ